MMGKFSPQLKELPGAVDLTSDRPTTMKIPAMTVTPQPPSLGAEEDLRIAQSLLERVMARTDLPPAEAEALREVLFGLRERNMQRVGNIWRDAFAEVRTADDTLKQAQAHLESYFGKQQ